MCARTHCSTSCSDLKLGSMQNYIEGMNDLQLAIVAVDTLIDLCISSDAWVRKSNVFEDPFREKYGYGTC